MAEPGRPGYSYRETLANAATQSDATESVTLAMGVTFVLLLIAGAWFGKARDFIFGATGKGTSITASAAPATAGSSGQSGFDSGSAGGGAGGGGGGTF